MEVSISGDTSSENYSLALSLRGVLESLVGKNGRASIVVGAFTPGCSVQDTDLIVLGVCDPPYQLPRSLLPSELGDKPLKLSNFALAIEVKAHSQEKIRFEGNQVLVRYRNSATRRDEWHGATDQNRKQIYSLKNFLEREQLKSPHWIPILWLRNVASKDLPKTSNNLLGSEIDSDCLTGLILDNRFDTLFGQSDNWQCRYLRCARDEGAKEIVDAIHIFTRKLVPSILDRKKIERITKTTVELELPGYVDKMGTQLLIFRGRGGSGKTVRLLQLANRLLQDQSARVLFLTYNRALASDLRRLMHLMGIREFRDQPTISIRTSEKFFWELMTAWGEAPSVGKGQPFPSAEFEEKKLVLRNLFAGETKEDLQKELSWQNHPSLYNWDYVIVDEAQDWPESERDILAALFGAKRLVVADGVDQLVRRDGRCDWAILTESKCRQIVPLRKALRLKSNLSSFVEAFVSAEGLEWDMVINTEVLGGNVFIIVGEYTRDAHTHIMGEHKKLGNAAIDALFCVTGVRGSMGSRIGEQLIEWGEQVWDGSIEEVRDSFPERLEQLRIVKYESCRGLEGWTVVCLDFDVFFERQWQEGMKIEKELFETQEEVAARYSARWAMIPMTRAIDTLVIQVRRHSEAAQIMTNLASGRDYVTIIKT
jgi:AAA domain